LLRACLVDPPADNKEAVPALTDELIAVLLEARRYEAAVPLCRRELKGAEGPRRWLLRRQLASALLSLEKPEEALAQADAAVREAPEADKLTARRQHALVLSRIGKHTEAIAECQALAKEYNLPGDVRAIRFALSLVYAAAKEPDKAERQLRLLLDADPNDAVACNDLGYQLAEQGKQLDEAERLIRHALELDRQQRPDGGPAGAAGDNAAYVDSLGYVLFRRGKIPEACKELERATQLPEATDDPTVWNHLGDVYDKLGARNKAIQAWSRSSTLFEQSRQTKDEQYRGLATKLHRAEPRSH
jgi:tetratricopeptide (TPR) repeat protein